MKEGVVELLELDGEDALAREEQRVGHFAEDETQDEGRRGKKRRAVQGGGEGLGELDVCHGLWGDDVERAADAFVCEHEAQDGGGVVESDPAHPLLAAGDFSPNSKLKRSHHLRDRAAMLGEDDSEAC